ncbi:MAG: dihydrofolate reductase, partial [Anaerolineae bacterium]
PGVPSEGLVDETTVTVMPIILGAGIPLHGSLERDIRLAHVRTTVYDFGFVQTTYSVEKNA